MTIGRPMLVLGAAHAFTASELACRTTLAASVQKSLDEIAKAEGKLAILAAKCTVASVSPAALGFFASCGSPCESIDILGVSGLESVAACLSWQTRSDTGLAMQVAVRRTRRTSFG